MSQNLLWQITGSCIDHAIRSFIIQENRLCLGRVCCIAYSQFSRRLNNSQFTDASIVSYIRKCRCYIYTICVYLGVACIVAILKCYGDPPAEGIYLNQTRLIFLYKYSLSLVCTAIRIIITTTVAAVCTPIITIIGTVRTIITIIVCIVAVVAIIAVICIIAVIIVSSPITIRYVASCIRVARTFVFWCYCRCLVCRYKYLCS